EAKRTAQRAVEMAGRSGDPMTVAAAEVALAEALFLHGEGAQTSSTLRLYLPQLASAGPEIANSVAARYAAFCQISAEDYEPALRGLLALGREQWATARENLEQLQRMCRRLEVREPGILRFQADLIEALVRLGDRNEAEQVLAELEEQANVTGRRWARIAA